MWALSARISRKAWAMNQKTYELFLKLSIKDLGLGEISNYHRSLNLDSAIIKDRYIRNGKAICKSLKVGQFYTFRIRKKSDRSLAIINGDERCLEKDWTSEGNGVYSTTFMPRATGRLTFALKNNATKSNYNGVVYRIHRVPCLRIGLFLGSEDGIAVELPYAL